MAASSSSSSSSANTFRFLVTTDNHLGFQEKDPRRCHDSFVTFEECLRAATVEHGVDAILLAGDLFHDNKPSLHVMNRSIGLLRKYVMGNKPIGFSLLSDPAINFPAHPLPCANFQDPNLNVAVPVFTIHGNHDDPLGDVSPSPVDVLAASGLVNHFGHVSSVDSVVVRPVLLQKGSTFIALYGLGAMHDQRLHRCFERKQVQFLKPLDPPPSAGGGGGARWFNILLFHQNRGLRVAAGATGVGSLAKAGIPEAMLAGFGFDLVIWGNEHEQLMVPQPSAGFDIVQPGSTIMTSLSASECNPKQYGVLEVRGGQYRLTPHPLSSLRPVVRRQVELWRDQPHARSLQAVEDYLRAVADEMIGEAEDCIARIPDEVLNFHPDLKFPLMRLSVDYSSPEGGPPFPQPNANRFGQQFLDVVVNANDVLKPIKPSSGANRHTAVNARVLGGEHQVVPVAPHLSTVDIRSKIASVFNANARDACALLSEPEVASAVYQYADRDDRTAIDATIERLVLESNKSIWKTLRKGKENLAQLREEKVRELALRYKLDTTRHFVEMSGEAELAAEVAPDAIRRATAAANEAEVHALLGLDTVSGAGTPHHQLGVALPMMTSANEAPPLPILMDVDDGTAANAADCNADDEDDAAALAELERLLPKGMLSAAAKAAATPAVDKAHGGGGGPLHDVDDDGEDCIDVDVAAQPSSGRAVSGRSGRGAGRGGRGGATAVSKRGRSDDDVVVVEPKQKKGTASKASTRGGGASTPAAGPRLMLSKGPVPPPPPAATGGAGSGSGGQPSVLNVVAQWTR